MNPLARARAALALSTLFRLPSAQAATEPTLTWHGQACFELRTPAGVNVLIDPIPGSIGYELPPPIKANVITISHEHPDHTNVALAQDSPKVLRGLTKDAKEWNKVDAQIKDLRIRNVGVYH